jgi:Pyridoxamine 5'-phosphate oxidase
MRLDEDSRRLLGSARIGMLGLSAGTFPVVNPAAFWYSGDSVWMTTSRFAAKLGMARRDPRAAFIVERDGHSVLLQGVLDAYDPRNPSSAVRAALEGPRFALSMAGYAVKNAAFIGGYMLDVAGVPREWWLHNRVVLRLRADRARTLVSEVARAQRGDRIFGAPAAVAKGTERESEAILCWTRSGGHGPQLLPVLWAVEDRDLVAWVPEGLPHPADGYAGAAVVEYHHPFRATRMVGACPRGRFHHYPGARAAIEARYEVELGEGIGLRLRTRRVTWWRGFDVSTTAVATVSLSS